MVNNRNATLLHTLVCLLCYRKNVMCVGLLVKNQLKSRKRKLNSARDRYSCFLLNKTSEFVPCHCKLFSSGCIFCNMICGDGTQVKLLPPASDNWKQDKVGRSHNSNFLTSVRLIQAMFVSAKL